MEPEHKPRLNSLMLALWSVAFDVTAATYIKRLKAVALQYVGNIAPVGDGDSKTAAPGTYRNIEASCVRSCPMFDEGCYAQGGNVNLHQVRASAALWSSLAAAAIAFVWAARTLRMARLHVSGDLCKDSGQSIDWAYVSGLRIIANAINDMRGTPRGSTVGWSYTHVTSADDASIPLAIHGLRAVGIAMRRSDHIGSGGAMVGNFAEFKAMRAAHPKVRFVKCRAQLQKDVNCASCGLCWDRMDLCVFFDPEGAKKKAVRERVSLAA